MIELSKLPFEKLMIKTGSFQKEICLFNDRSNPQTKTDHFSMRFASSLTFVDKSDY